MNETYVNCFCDINIMRNVSVMLQKLKNDFNIFKKFCQIISNKKILLKV